MEPLLRESGVIVRKKPGYLSLRALAALLLAVLVSGCGYHIAGKSGTMPGGIKSLSIPVFANSTAKPDIEGIITSAFVSEFTTTVNVKKDAEAEMIGNIVSYKLKGVSFTGSDVTQEYRLTVVVSIAIRDRKDGHVIWQDSAISDYEDFSVNPSDVTRTEEVEIEAFRKLSIDLARKIKERMLEGF